MELPELQLNLSLAGLTVAGLGLAFACTALGTLVKFVFSLGESSNKDAF